ncbi:MAG: flavocytochrome c [Eubacteriales bacterium]|nr:flavocytochrome c [Eubacteriales bacterium]
MKKRISLLLCALLLCSCFSWAVAEDAVFTPGVYTKDVTGHNAPFTVQVTVDDSSIVSVEAVNEQETDGIGKLALNRLIPEIVEQQNAAVDGVSGATVTSATLLYGVRECLKEAAGGNDISAFTTAPEKTPAADETIDTDVAIVGGGGAGLIAAISAAQSGAHVVIVEKLDYLGGSTMVSGGALNAADEKRQATETMTDGLKDTVEKYIAMETADETVAGWQKTLRGEFDAYLASGSTAMFDTPTLHKVQTYFGGHETGTPALIEVLCDNVLDGISWMEEQGVAFKDQLGTATGALYQRSHYGVEADGIAYTRVFEKKLEELKDLIDVRFRTPATSLVVDDNGRVTGVVCEHEGATVTVNAKNVILATGGFGSNIEMRQQYNTGVWSDVELDSGIGCSNINPCAQGDGIVMAQAIGAQLTGMSDIQLHPNGDPSTGLFVGIPTSGRNRIFVDIHGARFVNEGAARDTLCKAIFQQEDKTYWVVVNSVRYQPEDVAAWVALSKVVEADTLDELAEKTGMDAETLKASVDTYNATIGGAEDPLGFTVGSSDVALTEGPWYAARKVPTVHHTMGGVTITTDAQVMNESGSVIEGLYACGEVTGGIHGSNRLGGNAIADILVYGRIAGQNAAK